MDLLSRRIFLTVIGIWLAVVAGSANAELRLEQLREDNWDALVPAGKEVDAIYGDYALQNDHLVAIIGNPIPTRNANMTVGNVGGAVIDITTRSAPNDQLSAYYPGGGQFKFHDPDKVQIGRSPQRITLTIEATTARGTPQMTVRYSLGEKDTGLRVESIVTNVSETTTEFDFRDMLRADRTFKFGTTGAGQLFWAHDEWFQQAVGIYSGQAKMTHSGTRGVVVSYDVDGKKKLRLTSGQARAITRYLIPARHRLALIGEAQRRAGLNVKRVTFEVFDSNGPVRNAEFSLSGPKGQPIGVARTDDRGQVILLAPKGEYLVDVRAIGRPSEQAPIELSGETTADRFKIQVQPSGYVQAEITDDRGGPIPCKVSFTGKGETKSPDYGPESGTYQVRNCVYTEDGTFKAEIGPGQYDVIISRGPEYDALFLELTVQANQTTPLRGSLVRTVATPGWVSADFHSHSSPSGDNSGSQLGRVLNLLAENVEFAPCTEHNRVSTYAPHLDRLSAHQWMSTCPGIELTGAVLPVNHQNAFPIIHRPRTQDGGGPTILTDPIAQIRRLAMWDSESDKLVQENHPNLARILGDKDEDGTFDEGFRDMLQFMDVVEIHPPATILLAPGSEEFEDAARNPAFRWLQMLNRGYRIPGVVNTDAHYNFHESGWIRNYVRSSTDEANKIDTMEMVHQSEKGRIVMTTGPFMEVQVTNDSKKAMAEVGGDLRAETGKVHVQIRVQCANWFDINRVQILVNGRLDDRYNYTRRKNGDLFANGVVKFDQEIPLEVGEDAHIIVVAAGEGLQLGPVMGPRWAKQTPIAVSNPIFVDRDGGGFKPNRDNLGVPFPISVK
jgi:hypothetical protein